MSEPTLVDRFQNPEGKFAHLLWKALDWIYPPVCAGCGTPGFRWCNACIDSVQKLDENSCSICGDFSPPSSLCAECAANRPAYLALRSWGKYTGVLRKAIHRLKFRSDMGLAEPLSIHLNQVFTPLHWPIDLVVPVPCSKARLKERGYNQAALLAKYFCMSVGFSFSSRAILRTRDTLSQVGKSALERRANVTGVFQAVPELVQGKTVLVVDDVATTGSTIQSCAVALLDAGAYSIYGLTLARAGLSVHNDINQELNPT